MRVLAPAWPRGVRRLGPALAVLLVLAAPVVPGSAVQPVTISVTRVEQARHVDFDDGLVWILVLGSDARPPEDLVEARTDAIQLVALDLQSGRAAGIGVPRDAYVEIPGHGVDRINTAAQKGGTELTATVVADLVGVTPDYVFIAGFEGFRDMVDTIGGVDVEAETPFYDEEFDLDVRQGTNEFDGTEALNYSRSRIELAGGDFARSANQQQVMLGILRQLLAHEDDDGFMERAALSALSGLDTDLAPTEIYRLAQALTSVRPDQVTTCVIGGTDTTTEGGDQVILPDVPQARRLGADAADARLDPGCQTG